MISLPTELHALSTEFDRERPNVLVVVGAGVSFGATGESRASWAGLLEHGVETLRTQAIWSDELANANLTLIRNAFSSTFDLDEVLARAESVSKALGAPNEAGYGSWLADAIGSLKTQDGKAATLDAIKQLKQAGALILTTNYDNLLGDATGLSPVTWQDHGEFLRVLNREREGVLHIHGHWSTPSSVILGRKSYGTILDAPALQDLFKSIWLHWSWLYVGCGNGLDDPNVGRLLHWGHNAFGESARKHYFLAKEQDAAALSCLADKPANLIPVAYRDHAQLPNLLRALTPLQRPWPFIELGPASGPVRKPGSLALDIPLPSWQELLDGDVPAMAVDLTVSAALRTHGWALVYDVASVGKTTLALRLAAGPEYRNTPAFYLDLAQIGSGDDVEPANIFAVVQRLAHTQSLLILDNVHWSPQVTLDLWNWWLNRPRSSYLLMMATRIQYTGGIAGDDGLIVIEHHPSNPAIPLRPEAEDLPPILNYIIKRICGRNMGLQPPEQVLAEWHATFGNLMGAFTAAVTSHHPFLRSGQWRLPRSAAADWIYNRHFRPLTQRVRENLICIAAFATLELDVIELALPHATHMSTLLRNGLVERRKHGLGQHSYYVLREPDWGALLLDAIEPQPNLEEVWLTTACRHARMALSLSSRLSRQDAGVSLAKLWRRLCDPAISAQLVDQLTLFSLPYSLALQSHAAKNGGQALIDEMFDAWQAKPDRLVDRAFETSLNYLATFVEAATRQGRTLLVQGLWAALEANPDRLAERALDTPLDHLATFIEAATKQGQIQLVQGLWTELEAKRILLAERALDTPLNHLATFIEAASQQGQTQLLKGLWAALETKQVQLVERAFDTPLNLLATFIESAQQQGQTQLLQGLWAAFAAEPDRLAKRALATRLDYLATFIEAATKQGQTPLVQGLWTALAADQGRLAERAFDTPLDLLATFIEVATKQGQRQLVQGLWTALAADQGRLAERAFDMPLNLLATFIDKATKQGQRQLAQGLWTALEADPSWRAERAFEVPLHSFVAFINTAMNHQQGGVVEGGWAALAAQPDRLQKAIATLNGSHLLGFLKKAPESIGRLAIANLELTDVVHPNDDFYGAPRLATQCAILGREDLAADLRHYLLHHADPRWFSGTYAALLDVALLLSDMAASELDNAEAFMARVCTPDWLKRQYSGPTKEAILANALVLLALSLPASTLQRLRSPALTHRVARSLAGLADTEGEVLSGHVQFLGAAPLIGWRIPRQPFAAARLDRIARLPSEVLPHRSESDDIEPYQRNLWLGLRAMAMFSHNRLRLDHGLLEETLRRWHINQGNSAAEPEHTLNRFNQSMIAWLQSCVEGGHGVLLSCKEPMWLITGATP